MSAWYTWSSVSSATTRGLRTPARVPKVIVMAIKTPAYMGAMSKWLICQPECCRERKSKNKKYDKRECPINIFKWKDLLNLYLFCMM